MEKKNEELKQSNLNSKKINKDIKDLLAMSFTTYKLSESYKTIYKKDPTCAIPKRLIEIYSKLINPDYNHMIYSFKKKYISNEALVEKNDSKEEKQGLNLVYEFIEKYDTDEKGLDIFILSLTINSMLWKYVDEKNNADVLKEREELENKVLRLKKEAKEEKNIAKFKEARMAEDSLHHLTYKSKIGGRLRSNDYEDEVMLKGTDIKVPKASDAMRIMNSYISKEKKEEFNKILKDSNIIDYIAYCVKETTDLIKVQPFMDGNKRTFRSLLNLMLKAKNMPPVYVKSSESEEYKDALFKAMRGEGYNEIIGFYLFKICDSIYELDIKPYQDKRFSEYKKEDDYGDYGDTTALNRNRPTTK